MIKEDPDKDDELISIEIVAVIIIIIILIIVFAFLMIKKSKKEDDPKFKIAEAPPQKIPSRIQPGPIPQPIVGNRCPTCTNELTVFPDGSYACQNCGFKGI